MSEQSRIVKTILKKKNEKFLAILSVKSYSKVIVIKTELVQHANGIDLHLYGNFVKDSGGNISQWRKDQLFKK